MKLILDRALNLLTLRFAVQQGALLLSSMLLFGVWLRVPDSGIGALLVTLLLGLLTTAVLFFGEAALLRQVAGLGNGRGTVLRGAATLLAAALVWFALSSWIDHLSLNDSLRAGYLNSRFSSSVRNVLTFPHLLRWLGWCWELLRWLMTGAVLACSIALVQGRGSRGILRLLRSGSYWLTLLLGSGLLSWTTRMLMHWVPGQELGSNAISLVLRLVAVSVLNLTIGGYILTTATAVLMEADSQSSPGGGDDVSQPRTA